MLHRRRHCSTTTSSVGTASRSTSTAKSDNWGAQTKRLARVSRAKGSNGGLRRAGAAPRKADEKGGILLTRSCLDAACPTEGKFELNICSARSWERGSKPRLIGACLSGSATLHSRPKRILLADAREQIVQMSNGCICCSIREDLRLTLRELADKRTNGELQFERVVIETTGLA